MNEQILQILAQTLNDNLGNRITVELANGIYAKIHGALPPPAPAPSSFGVPVDNSAGTPV